MNPGEYQLGLTMRMDDGVMTLRLRRNVTGLKLDMSTLLGHFGLPSATAEQVDAELERDA